MNDNLRPFALVVLLGVLASATAQPSTPARDLAPARTSAPSKKMPTVQLTRTEKLSLLNGDKMSGKFLGIENGLLRWQHPSADGVISFKSADVSSLVIAQKPRPQGARLHNSAVGLINGDRLLGDLIELTPELLVLDTWYGGRLTLPRSAVAELNPVLMGSRVVFQSREGDDSGWLYGNYNQSLPPKAKPVRGPGGGANAGPEKAQQLARKILNPKIVPANAQKQLANQFWKFDGSGFTSGSSGSVIARSDIDYPNKFELAFDLQWAGGTSCYFNAAILASDIKSNYAGDHYQLQVSSSYFYLNRRTKTGNQVRMGRAELREQLSGKTRVRVGLLIDRLKREITLVLDGKVIQTYHDSNKDPLPVSRGLSFQSNNSYPLRISKITVSQWSGKLPGNEVKADGTEDFIFFKNKDHIKGKIKSIKDGKVIVDNASFGEVPVPLSKVARLQLANPVKAGKPKAGASQAILVRGGKISGQFEKWTADKVRLVHPYLGAVEFHPAVFESLEMNRDQPRPQKHQGFFSK
jgi:hypothetical protein